MLIYARGKAVVEHGETAERFEIHSDELDWEPVHGSERSMGLETVYVASVEHEHLGELRWTVSEYPVGAESFKETDVGKHVLLVDFDYGLEEEPEEATEPSELRDTIKDNPTWAASLTQAGMIQHLVNWFHHYYTDPANETPYESSEGGYLYVYGGPYSAEEEIRENFEGLVPEDAILRAVAEIEKDGIFDWAPSSNHPDQLSFADEVALADDLEGWYNFDELAATAASAHSTEIGKEAELDARSLAAKQVATVKESLPDLRRHGGMGHNNPPETLELGDEQIAEVTEDLDVISEELAAVEPNIERVAQKASRLKNAVSWAAKKLDLTFEEFCKSFGATLGKAAGYGVPILITSPFWGSLLTLLGNLKDWILVALGL